jgi:transcriptional regulator with XRE-family HTH domain
MNANYLASTPSHAFISTYETGGGYTRGVPSSIAGKRISQLRVKAGFATQQALAEAAGIDGSKLSRLENDKPVNLTLKTLERLAQALKVSVGALFDNPRPEKDAGLVERPEAEDHPVLADIILAGLDADTPAEDSWRGDVLKALHVLNRALRREAPPGDAAAPAAKTRR